MDNSEIMVKKRVTWFVALSIFTGWVTISLIPLLGLDYGEKISVLILMAMMFTPAISNLLTRIITKEGYKNMHIRPNLKGNKIKYLLIYFGSTILLLLGGIVYFLVFPHMLDANLEQLNKMLAANGPTGLTPISMLIITILQVALIGPIINIIPTMGEELGWRGYLLPKLREIYSDRIALVVSGAIWGIWHLPAIVMGHNYGTDYIGYPWLGVLAMIIFCIILGIIEGYAAIKLESAVPAAMIHSTLNAGAAIPILLTRGEYNPLVGPAITGVVGGIPFIILAIVLFIKTEPFHRSVS